MEENQQQGLLTKLGGEKLQKYFLEYLNAHLDLFKYDISQSVSEKIANTVVILISVMCVSAFLFFGSVLVALLLNNQFDSNYAGVGLVALFYLLLLVPIYFSRKPLKRFLKQEINEIEVNIGENIKAGKKKKKKLKAKNK